MAAILVVTSCGGASAQPRVLLDTSGSGNASLTVESTQAGFDMHWSYDCANAGGRGVFVADVYSPDGTPDFTSPGVSEEGDMDSGVYHVPGAGRFQVKITSTCAWKLAVVAA